MLLATGMAPVTRSIGTRQPLEGSSPLVEYRKITDEILNDTPDEDRYPRAAAEAVRSFFLLRLGLRLGLRQKWLPLDGRQQPTQMGAERTK